MLVSGMGVVYRIGVRRAPTTLGVLVVALAPHRPYGAGMLRAWLAVFALQIALVATAVAPQHGEQSGPASAQLAWLERGEDSVAVATERTGARTVAVSWVAPRAALPSPRTLVPPSRPTVAPSSAPREPRYLRLQRFLI